MLFSCFLIISRIQIFLNRKDLVSLIAILSCDLKCDSSRIQVHRIDCITLDCDRIYTAYRTSDKCSLSASSLISITLNLCRIQCIHQIVSSFHTFFRKCISRKIIQRHSLFESQASSIQPQSQRIMRIYIALQDRLSFCLQYSETIFLASDHLVIILCIRSDLYVTDIQSSICRSILLCELECSILSVAPASCI